MSKEGECWRAVFVVGNLQLTWHDANHCVNKLDPDKYKSCHAVVLGTRLRTKPIHDCSGGRVRQVDELFYLYTDSEGEAQAVLHEQMKEVRRRGNRAAEVKAAGA